MGNIVLVGAGGTGMSGVAGLLYDLGYKNIVCIDGFQSELTDKLEKKGLKVIIGHKRYEPKLDDAIIYSEATVDSPEVTKAKTLFQQNKKIGFLMNYFQFLGEISKYFITVGFAGTNGKSSTTALAIYGAKDNIPNFGLGILGALVPDFNNQSYYINPEHINEIKSIFDYIITGKSANRIVLSSTLKKYYFFVEACEYKRHFLHLDLDYAMITSLELDHTDYYKDMDDYFDAFSALAEKTKQKILVPENLKFDNEKIIKVPIEKINFKHIWGAYNDVNGSLVINLLNTLHPKDLSFYRSIVLSFSGLRRRMELLGKNTNGALIYSDYGHMASSIAGGHQTLKEKYPDKKLFVIFQPHQINRILLGRQDFIRALKPYNKINIYDIYAARENLQEFLKKFSSENKSLGNLGTLGTLQTLGTIFAQACGGTYTTDIHEIIKTINSADENTIIVIFSAGDIDYSLRRRLSNNAE